MPCSTSNGQITSDYSVALRAEIGERLRTSMDQEVGAMPSFLQALMKRLGEERADNGV